MDKKIAARVLHREQKSIKKISQDLNLSRNTVRKYLRDDEVEYVPKKYTRVNQNYPQLKNHIETLKSLLSHDQPLPKKEKRSARKYYTQLQESGYSGSYDCVRKYVRKWHEKQGKPAQNAFIPQSFDPAEAYQFDWSEESVDLAGKNCKVKVGHFRLCYSRKFFVVAYLRESQEMLFDAHDKAFEFFGGITKRGIYDNMKTAVDKVFISKSQRKFNENFLCLMKHYLIEPTACNPAAGWEKGQVENQVDNVRDWFFKPKISCANIDDLNAFLKKEAMKVCQQRMHPNMSDRTIDEVFEDERKQLYEVKTIFGGYREQMRQVTSTCLINYDNNSYSVDCAYAHKKVEVRAYPNEIIVMAQSSEIARHQRCFDRNKMILNPYHYLNLLERKPGALRNGAPFKDWKLAESIQQVKDKLMTKQGGNKEMVDILIALRDYGSDAVEVACDLAVKEGVINAQSILNAVSRLSCEENSSTIETDEHLKLKIAPTANCNKYDTLLKAGGDSDA